MSDERGAFRISFTPAGSSESNKLHEMPFPLVIKAFEGDWYDAANLYRAFVIPNAEWVKKGRLIDRKNIPAWAFNLTTWL